MYQEASASLFHRCWMAHNRFYRRKVLKKNLSKKLDELTREWSCGLSGHLEYNYYAQLIDDAEGLEKIENLQSHDNNEIYEKAVKILETYWLEEEDETVPPGDGIQTGFNMGGTDVNVPSAICLITLDISS